MNLNDIYLAVGILVVLVAFVRWAYHKIWESAKLEANSEAVDTAQSRFIYDIATNHLPHIESSLTLIARHLNIELPEPPPIMFVAFKEKDKK